jgi:2-oxoglutarate dehydrogenase E2 component (dihydrolipoamide succinyltransferase)
MAKPAEALVVPALGESVTEATVAKWLKQPGQAIIEDETLVELETDKVTVEVNAPFSGVLVEIKANEGQTVGMGDVLGMVEAGEAVAKPAAPALQPAVAPAPAAQPAVAPAPVAAQLELPLGTEKPLSPAVRRMVDEAQLDVSVIPATGKDGRVTKADIVNFLAQTPVAQVTSTPAPQAAAAPVPPVAAPSYLAPKVLQDNAGIREERVPMTRLRQTIAHRLKDAQQTAAILTTFNEIDMTAVMDVRNRLKDKFEQRYGIKLGFMSFFVKAAVEALKEMPEVNASIDGTDFIYKHYYDIGVAVGAPQGLVVPVVRDADQKSFAGIEQDIAGFASKAKEGKLSVQDMTGGTFTISNGGTYGSLMSTPILNPPQSAILGMHKTEKRPVVINDKIEIRPMMYVALSYDHRIIDGKQAVTFLVRIKDCIEDPERMLLNV